MKTRPFQIDPQTVRQFDKQSYSSAKLWRRSVVAALIGLPVCASLILLLSLTYLLMTDSSHWCWLVAPAAIIALFFLNLVVTLLSPNQRLTLLVGLYETGSCTVEINPPSISFVNEQQRHEWPLDIVVAYQEMEGVLMIGIGANRLPLVIPDDAFESSTDRQRFIQIIARHVMNSRVPSAAL